MTLVLVRHAKAGDRDEWHGDDGLRPLDAKGRKQARRLVGVLAELPVRRIVTSPYLRCVQTVEPLAAARDIAIEHAPELGEQRQYLDAEAFLRALIAADAVACVHGGIEHALGLGGRMRKADVWVFRDALAAPEVLVGREG